MNNTPKNQGQQQPNTGKQKRRQSINKVQLLGNVGQDPEIIMKGDRVIASFSLAVDRSYYDKNTGQLVEGVNWIPVVGYNKVAETIRDYVKKGQQIQIVDGRLHQSTFVDQKTGQNRYSFSVIIERLLFMGGRKEQGEQGSPHEDLPHPVDDFDPDFDDDIPM